MSSAQKLPSFFLSLLLAVRSLMMSGNPAAEAVSDHLLFPVGLAASVVTDVSVVVLIAEILLLIASAFVKNTQQQINEKLRFV